MKALNRWGKLHFLCVLSSIYYFGHLGTAILTGVRCVILIHVSLKISETLLFIFVYLAICMSFEMAIFSSLTYLEGFDGQLFLDFKYSFNIRSLSDE